MAETIKDGKQIMDKIASIKGDNDPLKDKNRATVAGGTVGLLIGIYYGYSRKKSVVICGVIGAALGSIVSRLAMPK